MIFLFNSLTAMDGNFKKDIPMYFFRKNKQYLDLTGNLILSHNDTLIKSRSKSCCPEGVKNATFFDNVTKRSRVDKIKITISAIKFIWGKSQALTIENTALKLPYVKNK